MQKEEVSVVQMTEVGPKTHMEGMALGRAVAFIHRSRQEAARFHDGKMAFLIDAIS